MTIAQEKVKQANARYDLVRISPRRHLSSTMVLIDAPNNIHSVDLGFSFYVESVVLWLTASSVSFTRTTVNPPASQGEYYADEEAGLLVIRTGALAVGAPNETTRQYVLTHRLYLSNNPVIAPSDTTGIVTDVYWDPRLEQPVGVSQTFKNQAFGKFTYGNTSISILNNERYFQKYLGTRDSFNRAEIKVWHCIGDVSNRALVFKGRINSIQTTIHQIKMSAYDDFYAFEDTATMGDASTHTTMTGGRLADEGKVLPLIVAPRSYQKTVNIFDTETQCHQQEEATEGYVSTYSRTKTTSSNRSWRLGRVIGGLATQSFGTIVRGVDNGTHSYAFFSAPQNLYVGDTISYGALNFGLIIRVGTFEYLGDEYNVVFERFAAAGFTTGAVMIPKKSLAITITGITPDGNYPDGIGYPIQTRDYSVTETTTAGGHKSVSITFVSGFELGPVILDPDKHHVWWCAGTIGSNQPGSFLQRLIEKAGGTANAASFTALDAAIVAGAPNITPPGGGSSTPASPLLNMSIPLRSESAYGTYSSYISVILESILGFLRLNTSLEAEGYLIDAPASTDARTEDEALDLSVDVEYRDLANEVQFANEHCPEGSDQAIEQTQTNLLTPRLHLVAKKVVKTTVMNHTLVESSVDDGLYKFLTPARGAAILRFLSNRSATYKFSTASLDVETALGDDVLLTSDVVLGGETSAAMTVTHLQKSTEKISVQATDFAGM